jgi:hypothetical protein
LSVNKMPVNKMSVNKMPVNKMSVGKLTKWVTGADDDLVGGQLPDRDGRLGEALIRQVRRVSQHHLEVWVQGAPTLVSDLKTPKGQVFQNLKKL